MALPRRRAGWHDELDGDVSPIVTPRSLLRRRAWRAAAESERHYQRQAGLARGDEPQQSGASAAAASATAGNAAAAASAAAASATAGNAAAAAGGGMAAATEDAEHLRGVGCSEDGGHGGQGPGGRGQGAGVGCSEDGGHGEVLVRRAMIHRDARRQHAYGQSCSSPRAEGGAHSDGEDEVHIHIHIPHTYTTCIYHMHTAHAYTTCICSI